MSTNWILAAVIAGAVIYTKFFDDQPIQGFFGGQPTPPVAAATPEPTPAGGWMFDPKRQGNLDKKAYSSGGKPGTPGGRAVSPAGRATNSKLDLSRLDGNVVVE
jgi:hypothetical protein